MAAQLLQYSWVLALILAVVGYKFVLRVFLGMVVIPQDKIGLVTKKFVLLGANRTLPDGKIIALNGEAGYQADTLAPGLYWFYWPWQYTIDQAGLTVVPKGKIGIVEAKDGSQLPMGSILARHVDCDNYQDARAFMQKGGQRGMQLTGKFLVQRKHLEDGSDVIIMTGVIVNFPPELLGISDEMWVTNFSVNDDNNGLRFTQYVPGDSHIPSPEDFLSDGMTGKSWKKKEKLSSLQKK